MEEELPKAKSKLYALEPLLRRMPEIAVPKRHVSFKEKFIWTAIALGLFFVMAQITLYGIPSGQGITDLLGQLKYIFASQTGTLMELGIGPIVTAGIIMQLLVGSKVINLDLTNPEDRSVFTSTQKLLSILVGLFEGSMLVLSGRYGVALGSSAGLFILFQLTLGAVIVIFLDEIVSKYGFGSGVSLFIAGGVAMGVFWQAINPSTGVIPTFISDLGRGESFISAFFTAGPNNMMGVVATILIFFVVVYTESLRVEIPVTYTKFGGIRGKYPIKFIYTSNIPVILAMTVFANFRIASAVLNIPWLAYYTQPPNGLATVMADPFRTGIYVLILLTFSVVFAWMWIYMTNMSPRDIARQLDDAGMMVPGYRHDIRVMEQILGRYIITTTILGGAFVALISAGADILGALGSGTGILLTVGIVYSLYQQIAREQVSEMFPAVRRLIGE